MKITTLIIIAVLSINSAFAGTGKINTTNKTIDLNVLFTYQETTDKLDGTANPTWKEVFNEASKRLWNASNGQLRIGKVTVYLRSLTQKDNADIWISQGSSGAYATGVAKLGVLGERMQFYQNTHRSLTGYKGDFSIVHEMGHYVFGAYDQYLGYYVPFSKKDTWIETDLRGKTNNSPHIYSIDPTSSVASIMDGGGGVSPNNDRTEFDTVFNTVKGVKNGNRWYMNKHYIKYKKSVWELLADFKWNGVNVFTDVPSGASDTVMPGSFVDIDFEIIPTLKRLVVTVDSSGSMGFTNMNLAKLGAKGFVKLAEEPHSFTRFGETITIAPDHISVVEFNSSAHTLYPMTAVDTAGTVKAAAVSRIDTISSGGSTAIGDGILTSLGQITGQGAKVSGEVIILLSDGSNNSGVNPITAAQQAKTRGARIFSISLGSSADTSTLSAVASITKGAFYHSSNGSGLQAIYTNIFTQLRNGGLLKESESLIHENEQASETVQVDEFAEEATFILSSPETGLSFSILSPSGQSFSSSDTSAGVYFQNTDNLNFYRVSNPEMGDWKLIINSPAAVKTYSYNVLTSTISPSVNLSVGMDKENYNYPEPILVTAKLSANDPVAGADVKAKVTSPNGILGEITLFDDGQTIHGDEEADDGRYSAYFRGFVGNGVYTFTVLADNKNGHQGTATLEKTDIPFKPEAIAPFTRESSLATTVSGAPSADIAWLRVNALSVRGNKAATEADIKLSLSLNNIDIDTDELKGTTPLTDDLTLQIGGFSGIQLTINASEIIKKGRKNGAFKVKSLDKKAKGNILANIGGSSKTNVVLTLKKVPLNNFFFSNNVSVSLSWGGFDQSVNLAAKLKGNKISYLSKKNFSTTSKLYINGLNANIKSKKQNNDNLRVVANYAGFTGYDPDIDNMEFDIAGYTISVPAGRLKVSKNGKTAKGKIFVGNGEVKVNLNLDKQILTLRGKKLALSSFITDGILPVSLNLGSYSESSIIKPGFKRVKNTDIYKY